MREAVETEISSASKDQKRVARTLRAAKASSPVGVGTSTKGTALPAKYSRHEVEVSQSDGESVKPETARYAVRIRLRIHTVTASKPLRKRVEMAWIRLEKHTEKSEMTVSGYTAVNTGT